MAKFSIIADSRSSKTSYKSLIDFLRTEDFSDLDIHIVTGEVDYDFGAEDVFFKTQKHLLDALVHCEGEFLIILGSHSHLAKNFLANLKQLSSYSAEVMVWYATKLQIRHADESMSIEQMPHFSPERLLGYNYLRSGFIVRKSAIVELLEDAHRQSCSFYSVLLQLTWRYPLLGHIGKPIFVDLLEPNSDITDQYEYEVVRKELNRREVSARVDVSPLGSRQIQREIIGNPLVSIVIPTGCRKRVVRGAETLLIDQCIRSIIRKSSYQHFEIIVVQDQRDVVDTSLLQWSDRDQLKVIPFTREFNFSEKCNLGFVYSQGHFVIFLNDDVEIITPNWIEILIGHLQDIGVGMSGSTLLFDNGTIQSASLCNNPAPHNYGAGQATDVFAQSLQNRVAREVSGLTGACIALRREVYEEVGGMSVEFPNSFNDIDLCFKLLYKNYRMIWSPFAVLTHFEAQSRDPSVSEEESQRLRSRWGRFFGRDKFTPA